MSYQEFFQELKKDHEKVTNILQQMKSQASQESGDLLVQLKREIIPHQEAEEGTFYKALAENQRAHKLALKAMEEHHVADSVLKEMEKSPRDDRWAAKLEVLDEIVQEHIKEEESEVFAAARALEESEINNILRDFQRTKLKIRSDMNKQASMPETGNQTRSSLLADEDLGQMV